MFINFFNRKPKYTFYIRNRDDIIRVHITKTAGTSLTRALKFNPPNKKKGNKKHFFAREIIDKIGEEKWKSAFKFSFVRNPWDRLYSHYRFLLRLDRIENEQDQKSYKSWLMREINELAQNPYSHVASQVDWLKDYHGNLEYDFIGYFEHLDRDVQKLGQLIKKKIRLPHVNQTLPHVHYSKAYDSELEEMVRIHYQDDIDTFNYQFERI